MKRILTLDGGGIKGVFTASFLAAVEDALGESITSYFDLVVGTSTGGIIALGLGLGYDAATILTFYEQLGPRVFRSSPRVASARHLLATKYDSTPLRTALTDIFGDRRLGEASTRLVIPSLSLDTGQVYIYKTAHHPRFERDYTERCVNVALATAAAPTYFPTHDSQVGIPLVDGGMWANNPVGMAAVEAIGVLGWPRESIQILSLGCPTEPLAIDAQGRWFRGGFFWAKRIADLFMAAQSSASNGTAAVLLSHGQVCRISPSAPAGRYGLDKIQSIPSLRGLGASEARTALPNLREVFFTEPRESFVPFHTL